MQNSTISSFAQLQNLAAIAPAYQALRREYPTIPARSVKAYLDEPGDNANLVEFTCAHDFAYTGTAYGGDDERWMGEGRCYCLKCGKDGDA